MRLLFTLLSLAISTPALAQPAIPDIPAKAKADFEAGQHAQAVEHDFPKAIALLSSAIDAAPTYAMAYGSRGATYFQMTDYRHAANDFAHALQLGVPPIMEAQLDGFLGLTYRRLKQTDDAVRLYTASIAKFGETWNIVMQRGEAYQEAANYPKAQADFDRALLLSPDNPEIISRKMISFLRANDRENALIQNNRLLALRPNDINVLRLHQALTGSSPSDADRQGSGGPQAQASRMVALYDQICLKAFPDDRAVEAILKAHNATELTPAVVKVTMGNDPARGWRLQDGTATVWIEFPPFHACSVRWNAPAIPDLGDYRAIAARYESASTGFQAMNPAESDMGAIHIHSVGERKIFPDHSSESLLFIDQHLTDPKRLAAGETSVSVRAVHQFSPPPPAPGK